MKIRIYQIDVELDNNNFLFRNLAFIYSKSGERFPEEIYELVYEGEVDANNLNDIYNTFNQIPPKKYHKRELSVSDVFEIIHSEEKSSFYFVDSIGFVLIPFEKRRVKSAK